VSSFLAERRLFARKLDARMPALYLLDALLLPFLGLAVLVGSDLGHLDGVRRSVEVSSHSFAMLGAVGLYGFRIATWIAILRKNRTPQTAEWLVTLAGFAVFGVCVIFSSQLTDAYAAAHGYRPCGPVAYHREVTLMFAKDGVACPPPPKRPS
jgi:hypothetical protein